MRATSPVVTLGAIAFGTLGPLAASLNPQQQSALQLSALPLRPATSMCEITPERPPRTITLSAGAHVSYAGCAELDSTRLTPIVVTVRNTDTSAIDLPLPPLADVQVRTAQGFRPAVALWLRIPGGGAPMPSDFVREMRGIAVRVPARDSIQLLYLLPTPGPRATLRVGSLGQIPLPQAPFK